MTNSEIIQAECNVRGIEEEVNTFAYWKKIGYRVKQGEHALFETRLWKKRNKAQVVIEQDEQSESQDYDSENDSQMNKLGFYLVKSYLFGRHQVEPINSKEVM